jgi:putative FmdB family regulatory protein
VGVPTYEFRCTTCDTVFEEQRAMAASSDPATCPQGHPDARRLLSVFASTAGVGDTLRAAGPARPAVGGGGGCCGGSCGCG